MGHFCKEFESRGYVDVPNFLDGEKLEGVRANLRRNSKVVAGDRRLLDHAWCCDLAAKVRETLRFRELLSGDYVATLCTYFDKSAETNWGVASHRDLSVPVLNKFEKSGWQNWSEKQGIPHVQPPRSFLLSMFAVRINIDQSSATNGALIVAPSSHKLDHPERPSVVVGGAPGSALVMSPLIVHTSKKSSTGSSRRVLHFLFGPAVQPAPIKWFYAA